MDEPTDIPEDDFYQCDPERGCGELLPLESFHINKKTGARNHATCIDCTNRLTRERRAREAGMDDSWHTRSGSIRMACPARAVRIGARWVLVE